jgi:hypothetical protein
MLPKCDVVWLDKPESITECGGGSAIALKVAKDCEGQGGGRYGRAQDRGQWRCKGRPHLPARQG